MSRHTPLRLDVVASTLADVEASASGGADSVELVIDLDASGRTPPVELVERACAVDRLELRVMIRSDDLPLTPPARDRQLETIQQLTALPIHGLVLGFLTPGGRLDVDSHAILSQAASPLPWTLHRAFDDAGCPPLGRECTADRVLSAGGTGVLDDNRDVLTARAARGALPRGMYAAGRARVRHVAWLSALGVAGIHVGDAVRDSWTSPVQADRVAAFRHAIDSL